VTIEVRAPALIADLSAIVGQEHVLVDPAQQRHILKDFHYYSTLLEEALTNLTADAVVRPGTLAELESVVAAAVRHRVAITARGAGTGNYGQSLPLQRGVVIDIRRLSRVLAIDDDAITVEAGTVLIEAERAARERGREMRIMSTTYRVATAAGFIAGGSGGIGSVTYGRIWDGNVLAVELLTAEETPRTITLTGTDVDLVLHTYGTVGVISKVTFALAPAKNWTDHYAVFPTFEAACRFGWEIAADRSIVKRLDSLQEAPIPTMFEPVRTLFSEDDSAVLLILDADSVERATTLAQAQGGELRPWPARIPINQFPFSHSILWTKKFQPSSTWLQAEFSSDFDRFLEQVRAITARYGGNWLHHVELACVDGGTRIRPEGIPMIRDAGLIDDTVQFCQSLGMSVLNPHSYVVQEGGMVGDIDPVLRFKAQTDPYRLLNPGKVEDTFYSEQAVVAGAAGARG
jgi:FAD/FMN-containing dehydrogenase